uniref:Cilia and flagella associated protein 74 n=1 Tax=Cavia porcellus TaxID=10141 RepID=H0VY50_CAVPO
SPSLRAAATVPFIPSPGEERGSDAKRVKAPTVARDRVWASQLRRSLDLLARVHEENDLFLQKSRGELCACRHRMDLLSKQQANVAAEVARERESSNMAAVGRLQAASRRLQLELEGERNLQWSIAAELQQSESAMWHLEIKKGQLENIWKSNHEEAEARDQCLQVHAAQQLHREEEASGKAERNQRLRIRKSMRTQRELGLRHQKLVEDAQKNHRVAVKFLKASLGRVREREQKAELESREHLQQRMAAVLALKNSITANREMLRKFQAWDRARAEQTEQQAQTEQQEVLAQGQDAFKHLVHQRRRQELEAQRAFEEEQKLRKQEIVSRILKEEAQERSHRKRQRPPAKAAALRTLRDRTWSYISTFCEGKASPTDSKAAIDPMSLLLFKVSSESMQMAPGTTSPEEETLAKPEIPGLWSEDLGQSQGPKEDVDRKPVGGTKMDKDILARRLEQLRSRVVHKQVASGREFKGRPFNSKPECVHFKDFDVGKVYKKKITLINATYTLNYCKLVGVEQHLQDFIRVDFDPPGPLSAGMSCEVLVTFKPMINRDLEGHISFLAQTGGFSVPLKCSTKKCSLSLDKKLISFGSYVVGETASRTITLTNTGGLGTGFQILPASESSKPGEPQSVLKLSSLFTYEDRNLYERPMAGGVSESMLEASTSSPPDTQSQKESLPSGESLRGSGSPTPELGRMGGPRVLRSSHAIPVPPPHTPHVPSSGATHSCVRNQDTQVSPDRCGAVALSGTLCHRSKVSQRLRFEVCKELRGHLELLPEMGYIQAQASCSVQLKFLPRQSLPEDAGKYFDKDSHVLEAPMTIWVANQTKPVGFTVHAIVTTSDLELRPSMVDFGHCTVYEAIRTSISLCNHSLLPQEFGFVGLPKVDIQPNDGFGTILPLETLQLDVLFQPTRPRTTTTLVTCRCFKLSCRAVGVQPPLELSHYQIKFAATALYDTSVASLYVTNSHLTTSSLPRVVGSGDLCPVGPTSFEFLLPPDAPITISPSVGTVLPGKRCLVRVAFQPTLPHQLVIQEALETATVPSHSEPSPWGSISSTCWGLCRDDEYQAARATVARTFQGRFDKFVVPCVVASGDVRDRNGLEPLSFSPHNTLYLELWCPAVAPAVVVTSDKGKTVINFGDIAVGHCSIKKVSLQNTCPEDLALDFSVLSPRGPFFLVNTPSKLLAGKTRVLVLSFSPQESVLSQEMLEIITKRGTLTLTLVGTGVASVITCSLDSNILDMGYVLARESVSTGFKLQNDSSLPIKFSVQLHSLSSSRASDRQELPQFLISQPRRTDIVGTQNLSGQSVFSVVPVTGILDPGKAQDFTVTFSPDHESLYFSDRLQVVLFEKKVSHEIQLKGAAREHMMFVEGGDPLDVPVESLMVIPASDPEHREEAEELKPILLTLNYVQLDADQQGPPATRELQVGCIRTTQPSPKKPDQPLMVSTLLQLKGDVKENYKVIFVAHVVTGL